MTKHQVVKLQRTLRGLGLYWKRIDGDFGPATKEAVKKFQRMHGLTVDGIVGAHTMRELYHSSIAERQRLDEVHTLHMSKASGRKYPHESQCRNFYGIVGKQQTRILLPYKMKIAWAPEKVISRITCHQLVAEDMQGIFEDIRDSYGEKYLSELGLDLWGGTLNVRKIRGGRRYSTHSWGIATDIDPAHNRLRWHHNRARMASPLYDMYFDIIKHHGAISLGKLRDYDYMQFQFARR